MLVFEFKAYGKSAQITSVDDAIRTAKFIRNSCIRLWMDVKGTGKNDLQKYCAVLAANFPFANELNSMARQASAERAWSSISRFYDNCKKGILGLKGYPQFQKDCRSVEYKTSGWKLADNRKSITFTDKKGIVDCIKLLAATHLRYSARNCSGVGSISSLDPKISQKKSSSP